MHGIGIIIMPFSFLWGEVVSIIALCIYHLLMLIQLQRILNS
jgi:hypothetical protein